MVDHPNATQLVLAIGSRFRTKSFQEEAVRQASHQRLRPILMTTACAALGGIPMILSSGTGSEFRHPLGYAIVGGLAVSQALTLFTTPVIYLYLDRLSDRLNRRSRTEPATEAV